MTPESLGLSTIGRILMWSRCDIGIARQLAEAGTSDRVRRILRAVQSAATLSDPAWTALSQDYQIVATSFLESLRHAGIFDRLLENGFRRAPLQTRLIAALTSAVGSAVSSGSVKPVASFAMGQAILEPRKSAAIAVVSWEFLASSGSNAQTFLDQELRTGIIAATDASFLAEAAAGVSPLTSAGNDAASIIADIGRLLAELVIGQHSVLYVIMPPLIAKRLVTVPGNDNRPAFQDLTIRGGLLCGIEVLVSDQLADDRVLIIDASQFWAESELPFLRFSDQAVLELDTVPDSPPVATSVLMSTWQTDNRAICAERFFGFNAISNSAVAVLDGAAWGEAVSG